MLFYQRTKIFLDYKSNREKDKERVVFQSPFIKMITSRSVFVLCSSWSVILLFSQQQAGYVEGRNTNVWKNCANSELECSVQKWFGLEKVCVKKNEFCNGNRRCEDNSDEKFCKDQQNSTCPREPYRWSKCEDGSRCIPKIWWCDGHEDCLDGSDEADCIRNVVEKVDGAVLAKERAVQWLLNQRNGSNRRDSKNIGNWGAQVHRIAVTLCLVNNTFFAPGHSTGEEITSELKIRILDVLFRSHTEPISLNDLALYVQAMIATCLDPRYFHGMDLVAILRRSADSQIEYTNPFLLLTLCNAKDTMTSIDVKKLKTVFEASHSPSWTDTKTLALMALSCIDEQSENMMDSNLLTQFASQLKKLQNNNAKIQSLHTTALVMQALFATGEEDDYNDDENWKLKDAIKYLVSSQATDGSYGNLLNMYHILPVLNYKSFLNVSAAHCSNDNSIINIRYSLWLGENKDITHSLELRTAAKSTFFDVMKIAAATNLKYRFKYGIELNSNPYVYEVSGVQDDPEKDTFWSMYKVDKYRKSMTAIKLSPIEIMVGDNEEFIMWYRSGEVRIET